MDRLNTNHLYHLYTSEKIKKPLISDRSVDELVRMANKQLIRASWVIKDRAGETVRTYKDATL